MPKASKPGYYVVRIGRVPGIYLSWADCEAQVKGFPGAVFEKLTTEAEANEFMTAKSSTPRTSASRDIVPVASTSRTTITRHPTAEDEDNNCDIVYCDGACRGNGQLGSVAGIGVWWAHGDPRNISERCPGDQTNNRAELIAIVRILETTPHLMRRLLIKTDSKYSIQCVTAWISKWMKNGFLTADGKPVKNRTLIKYLVALLHARRKTSQTVEFKHVRGHVGIEGNEAADQLANLGITKPMVPERDWEKLEKEVLQSLKPVKVVDDDPKAYADGHSNDDGLAELADRSIVTLPEPKLPHLGNGNGATRSRTSHSPLQAPLANTSIPGDGTITVHSNSELSFRGPFRPPATRLQLVPSTKQSTTPTSKAELEMFASCLLGDDELSALGRDGMFDSDF